MAYMRQQGIGVYDCTGDWTWEFYPPPYDFLVPRGSVAIPAPRIYTRSSGLSGCHCGGTCADCSGSGLGLFDAGFDVTQWGAGEWIAALGIGYLAVSLVGDMGRGAGRIQRSVRRRSSTARRRAELKRKMEELG